MFAMLIAILYALLLAPYALSPALAQEPDFDAVNEVAQKLNCPTCSGINLADCRTQTCAQWKDQIKDLLAEGYTADEVVDYFATQYGTQVLQEPPKTGFTLMLWTLPFIMILLGAVLLFFTMRQWSGPKSGEAVATPAPAGPSKVSDDYLSQVDKDLGLE